MHIVHTFEELAGIAHDAFIAIGVFDGLHLGHQRVISQARDDARAAGGASVVLTFDPHPVRVLRPDHAPLLLTSTAHKLRLIAGLGVDAALVLPFDKPFSELTADAFLNLLVQKTDRLREVCVGTRFHFGHNRTGNVRLIEQFAPSHNFIAKEITSVMLGDEIISSTAVRQHVQAGNLDRAAAMLGRPFSILGTVVPGDALGRQLGFPTANLNPHNEVFPPDGVYVTRVLVGGQPFTGVINLGRRPTFEGRSHKRVLEVHILDFNRDIYGQEIEVVFLKKLRGEQKFANVEELKKQIANDVQAARQKLNR